MKKYLVFALLVLTVPVIMAQNVKNKYTFRSNGQGSVYFIHSLDGFNCKELKKDNKLDYDITFVSSKDSTTFNFTYKTPVPFPPDSVKIISGNHSTIPLSSSLLFAKPYKKGWEQRVSLQIPSASFWMLYKENFPFEIIIFSKDRNYRFILSEKKWKEQTDIINKIAGIIEYTVY